MPSLVQEKVGAEGGTHSGPHRIRDKGQNHVRDKGQIYRIKGSLFNVTNFLFLFFLMKMLENNTKAFKNV